MKTKSHLFWPKDEMCIVWALERSWILNFFFCLKKKEKDHWTEELLHLHKYHTLFNQWETLLGISSCTASSSSIKEAMVSPNARLAPFHNYKALPPNFSSPWAAYTFKSRTWKAFLSYFSLSWVTCPSRSRGYSVDWLNSNPTHTQLHQ